MSIDPSLVAKGKCYVTANGQVRRVVQITVDDYVEYQYRGPSYQLGEKSWSFMRIPEYSATCSGDIRPPIPGYPATFDTLL